MTGNRGLCFLIADGDHARFVRADNTNVLRTFRRFDSASAHLTSHEIGTDRPGRSFESARPGSHGLTPRHDLHGLAKTSFAEFVAEQADLAAGEGALEHLVLVASPHCLREIEER